MMDRKKMQINVKGRFGILAGICICNSGTIQSGVAMKTHSG
jgi:hypothetical protein